MHWCPQFWLVVGPRYLGVVQELAGPLFRGDVETCKLLFTLRLFLCLLPFLSFSWQHLPAHALQGIDRRGLSRARAERIV
jgi:hypothetical protein